FDTVDAVTRGVDLALLALQLATQFGHAAVGDVELALGVFALLFAGQQLVTEFGQAVLQLGFAFLQGIDLFAQADDLAFAQQRALLGRARARHAHPAFAQAFAAPGDHRIALAQRGLQRTRL